LSARGSPNAATSPLPTTLTRGSSSAVGLPLLPLPPPLLLLLLLPRLLLLLPPPPPAAASKSRHSRA
jgi:hypothetical protein